MTRPIQTRVGCVAAHLARSIRDDRLQRPERCTLGRMPARAARYRMDVFRGPRSKLRLVTSDPRIMADEYEALSRVAPRSWRIEMRDMHQGREGSLIAFTELRRSPAAATARQLSPGPREARGNSRPEVCGAHRALGARFIRIASRRRRPSRLAARSNARLRGYARRRHLRPRAGPRTRPNQSRGVHLMHVQALLRSQPSTKPTACRRRRPGS